ncbi:hypothetical protein FHS61_001937 [Altererythrobacter atlanticus]|uniref:Uncharacterized protein n=1 Tax=Croceibacterium atlanticum TaxID=1267766 RepID=A0A0F7KPF8_9SPHN|nr:hypothetical protein [Croceibacterium atlanticum]AKH41449.1 hypothetical protein WYH_00390 [Croceibacterium atlanticum]MBB5732911.1 hypothetical protein [Croceibacterium atlanticum]
MEIVANGLCFDISGLSPGESEPVTSAAHLFGLPNEIGDSHLEAILIRPGPHIAAARLMLPVARCLAGLGASFALLPGVQAVAWHSARSWSSPEHFRSSVLRWIDGGVFPGLGLAALLPLQDGGMASEGLSLFTGQEIRLAPELASDRRQGAQLAVRLMHWLVERGNLAEREEISGPESEQLILEPSSDRKVVEVRKG